MEKGERDKKSNSDTTNIIKCPHCGFEFEYMLKCNRCGHTWVPRNNELPTSCPNPECRSPYWNKPRVRGLKKNSRKVKK